MTDRLTLVGLRIENPAVQREFKRIVRDLNGFRLQNSGASVPCDILVVEVGSHSEAAVQQIKEIRERGETGAICVTSAVKDPDLLIQAMRAGAQEFIDQPLKDERVRDSILALQQKLENSASVKAPKPKEKGKIITVMGSKGGVGTTTLAVNLAAAFQNVASVKSTALVDMNLVFGQIPLFLDLKPSFHWGEIAKNVSRLDATYLKSVLAQHHSGVNVLPAPSSFNGGPLRPEVMEPLLDLMQREFDFIVIDSGLSLDALSMRILQLSDRVLIVSAMSLPSLMNVRRLVETLASVGLAVGDKVELVMNRYDKKSPISPKEAEESLQKEICWFVPNEYQAVTAAVNQGKTLYEMEQGRSVKGKLDEIVGSFAASDVGNNRKRSLFGWSGRKK